jgi:hypothetical protein
MRTRNGRRKVLFGTNYPMIFHEPALADLDALAFGDEARELYLSANAQRLFEGGPRRLLCLGERERAGWRVWCPQRTSSECPSRRSIDCRFRAERKSRDSDPGVPTRLHRNASRSPADVGQPRPGIVPTRQRSEPSKGRVRRLLRVR